MAKHYFGYGSLVNGATRAPHEPAVNAVLSGWRRTWSNYFQAHWGTGRSLSIEEAPDVTIAGALVELTDGALERLDERERGYERLELDGRLLAMDGPVPDSFYVYRSLSTPGPDANRTHPILRSYVDVVMQGYRDNFGADGLAAFLDTTHNWGGMMREDRHAPDYPRAVTLRDDEAALFAQLVDHRRQRD